MGSLHRYWFEFDIAADDLGFSLLRVGCGVTAFDRDDALFLIRQHLLHETTLPSIRRIVEDVSIEDLDQGHVIPNMGPPHARGIWFPKGYGWV
jgi:hypothetical protein